MVSKTVFKMLVAMQKKSLTVFKFLRDKIHLATLYIQILMMDLKLHLIQIRMEMGHLVIIFNFRENLLQAVTNIVVLPKCLQYNQMPR